MTKNGFGYHDAYANLAAAIIASGERCHDVSFLNSDWCDTLRTICKLDDELHDHHSIATPGKQRVSTPHVPMEVDI